MDKAIAIIDMPTTCAECFFCCTMQEISVGNGLYKKMGKCSLAKDIKDPWRNIWWQVEHKEEWCPLKSVPEEQEIWFDDERSDWERGYNNCLREIVGRD